MRRFFASFVACSLIASGGFTAFAAETSEVVNPFNDPVPSSRSVSARVSDDPEPVAERKPRFSLPKLSLPKLPTPSLPKPKMPNFKLPKLQMPQWAMKDKPRNPGPSTWQKLNSGTKSMFAKTRDTLMPWTVNDTKPTVRHATGNSNSTGFSRTRVASNRGSSAPPAKKKSLLSSFLPSPEPEPRRIESTSDFLSQERPRFD
ncbi:MAG: hypothetical protein H8E66_00850 [Planctomycetes bacterium]|nr:hypothetical protein [Planctomycetota bacterium]